MMPSKKRVLPPRYTRRRFFNSEADFQATLHCMEDFFYEYLK
jgi:hypothetical protein